MPNVLRPAARTMRMAFHALVLLLVVFLAAVPSGAQSAETGTVRGVTTTQDGTVFLPGVAIVLIDPSGARHAVTGASDETGHFVFSNLPAGEYELKASLNGFDDITRKVRIESGKTADVALDLPVAKLTESVNVVDRAPDSVPTANNQSISGALLTQAPVKGDNYQALLPMLPAVVRGSDGRMRVAGGEPTQSGLQVSSASVTDPSTGDFALDLPGDAVESVEVLQDPYSPEYGRFSSGVTKINTRKGGDRWQVIPNSFVPRLQTSNGTLRGIASFTPRLSIGGPLIKDNLFLSENLQYRLVRTDVKSLPGDPNSELHSFDSFTRLDANLTPRNALTAAFAVYPRTISGVGLSTFTPLMATPTFHQSGFNVGLSERATLSSSSVLETTFNVKQYDVDIAGQGTRPMELTVFGTAGNYFNQQTRNTRSVQAVSVLTYTPDPSKSTHLFKFGVDLLDASYDGASASQPIEIRRADGTLNERITFPVPSLQNESGTDVSLFAQDEWRASDRLQVQFGARLDRDGVLGHFNASPRSGFTLALDRDARAMVRGGIGLFYQHTPLSVGAFDSMDQRVVTMFGADGITVSGPPIVYANATEPLRTPFAVVGNIEYDQRISSALLLKVNVLRRHGQDEFIVDPTLTPMPALVLTSDGHSDHWEGEFTVRFTPAARSDLMFSYVRSRSQADLNSFDSYFGNFRAPVILANQYSLTSTDVPHRFLARGTIGLPRKFEIAPVIEIRTGFPYTVIDETQQAVGVRNEGGRFPTLATVDLSIQRPMKIHGLKTRIGFRVYNAFNTFNPRDFMNNVSSPLYGNFYNPIPRSIGLNFWIDR